MPVKRTQIFARQINRELNKLETTMLTEGFGQLALADPVRARASARLGLAVLLLKRARDEVKTKRIETVIAYLENGEVLNDDGDDRKRIILPHQAPGQIVVPR